MRLHYTLEFSIYKNTFFYFVVCLACIIFVTSKLYKMITTFYVTNILLLISIFLIVIFMYGRAQRLRVSLFQFRRRSFISVYIIFAIYIINVLYLFRWWYRAVCDRTHVFTIHHFYSFFLIRFWLFRA